MKMKYKNDTEFKVRKRIKISRSNIIFRKNFNDLSSYRQISHIFKKLIEEKKLVRISYGIYAKAYISKYSDTPVIQGGIDAALRETLKYLNIKFEPGSAEKAYNAGQSTQLPVKNIVKLKSRCRRRIGYKNNFLLFEKKINAK